MSKQIGDLAPNFSLPDQNNQIVVLEQLRQQGPVVVFFYPKDHSWGCTAEVCAFRDSYQDFTALGAVVIGISSDSSKSHLDFAERQQLPFSLLSDGDGQIRAAFGVPKTLGFFPGRSTYVIDGKGIIRGAFHSQIEATRHRQEALTVVQQLVAQAN